MGKIDLWVIRPVRRGPLTSHKPITYSIPNRPKILGTTPASRPELQDLQGGQDQGGHGGARKDHRDSRRFGKSPNRPFVFFLFERFLFKPTCDSSDTSWRAGDGKQTPNGVNKIGIRDFQGPRREGSTQNISINARPPPDQ